MSHDALTVKLPALNLAVPAAAQPRDAQPVQPEAEAAEGRPKPAKQAAPEAIHAVAQRIESYLKSVSRSVEFRVDADTGRTVVSVRDSQTGDLIRQIPGEEVLRLAEMADDQTIVLLDEKV